MSNISAGRSKWPYVPLSTVAEKIQDGTHFSPLSTSGPFRYVTSRNIRPGYLDLESCGWISEREHKAIFRRCDPRFGDILLTKDGANTGNASINTLREEISLLSSVAMIRTDSSAADGHFVLQYLLSPEGQTRLTDLVSGNAITRLTLAKIKSFSIPRAPLPEQHAIAAVLDTIDDAIQKTEQIIAKLQQVKQGLLHDLLTRGIDDNGELRDPERHPEQFQDSALGRIPRGWKVGPLSVVTELQVGYAFKSEWYSDTDGVRLMRGENVGYGSPDWTFTKRLPVARAGSFSEYLLSAGDVIIGMDRTFTQSGVKVTVLCAADSPALLVQRVGRFVPRTGAGNFLAHLLSWPRLHAELLAQQKGMDIPHLSKDEILSPLVPIPQTVEQVAIGQLLDRFCSRLAVEQSALEKLRHLKTALADDLLTGRVRTTSLPEFAA